MEWTNALFYFFYFLIVGEFHKSAALRAKKTCMDSEIEIFSKHGVHIEPFGKSRVDMYLAEPVVTQTSPWTRTNKTRSNRKFHLDLQFKTKKSDGVLFELRSNNGVPVDKIAVVLKGGDLHYKVQCRPMHATIRVAANNMGPLNDNEWHNVTYAINDRNYDFVKVDSSSNTKFYHIWCQPMTKLIVGGSRKTKRHHGHFQGCIRNLRIPFALKYPPDYYAVSVCS